MTTETKKEIGNIDLGKTQITDKIRLSSAAIFYPHEEMQYYQLETWVFSDDKKRARNKMVIHGTCGIEIPESLIEKTKTFHRRASKILLKKFAIN